MLWQDLRPDQFEEAIERSKGLCVIPIGCLEKHGQHLPVGTDYFEAREHVLEAAQLEDAVVFPTGFWLGDVGGYHARKMDALNNNHGGIGIKIETMLRILEELCDEIARNGFTKILILNGHGGNIAMLKTFLKRQSKKRYATMFASVANNTKLQPAVFVERITEDAETFPMITPQDVEVMKGWIPKGYQGGHANFLETAGVMANHPELVAPDKYDAEDGLNNHRTDYLTELGISIHGDWSARFPNMYSGAAPHGCSESIAQAMQMIHVERLVRVFRMVKADDSCLQGARI